MVVTKELISEFEKEYNLESINKDWFKSISVDEIESRSTISLSGKNTKVWKDVLKSFFKNKWNSIFLGVFILIVLLAFLGPLFSKYNAHEAVSGAVPTQIDLLRPSWVSGWNIETWRGDVMMETPPWGSDMSHVISQAPILDEFGNPTGQIKYVYENPLAVKTILGTDSVGRDVWSRLWVGTAWSLELAFFVAIVETIIGVSIGIYVGFNAGKRSDTIIMRVIEVFGSIPSLIWMMVFAMVIGTGFWSIAFVLILVGWVGPVYSARMFTMKIKDAEFIKAAEAVGVSSAGRLFKHILPNISGRLLVSFVHRIPSVIFFEASLIFLGLAVGGADGVSLGNMINESRQLDTMMTQPFFVGSVSVVILLITISLQIVANGMRDALDPKIVGGK